MSCTVNHLLIERGVKMRELGHFIMEGRDKMINKCSATVYDPTGWGHSSSCSRNGKIEEDSKWWCKQHAPSSIKARSEASSARWQADQDRRNAPYAEADRLRAVNAILLECLEGLFTIVGEALIEGDFDQSNKADIKAQHDLAREAIKEANK